MATRVCSTCEIERPIECFRVQNKKTGAIKVRCRVCDNARTREYRTIPTVKAIVREYNDKYRNDPIHKEVQRERGRAYRADPAIKAKRDKQSRDYHVLHKEEILQRKRDLSKVDAVKARKNEAERARRKNNPDFRIAQNLRRRRRAAIKSCDGHKHFSMIVVLGCSLAEFKNHIEQQFYVDPISGEDMSWANYGSGWHIDETIPCSAWNLTDPAHQRGCFNYTNAQPLWAFENKSKGGVRSDLDYTALISRRLAALGVL